MLSKLKSYLERNPSEATEIRERFASSNQRNLNGTSKGKLVWRGWFVDNNNQRVKVTRGKGVGENA
jgi:uncharacterized protein affecting Mg2+/Co2+ transport